MSILTTVSSPGRAAERKRGLHHDSRRDQRDGTTTSDGSSVGRDVGAVSTRNTSKGALIAEAHAVFRALASGKTLDEVRSSCLAGRLIRQSARETRRHIWNALYWRYFVWNPPRWVLADLSDAAKWDSTDRRFVGLAYLHFARRDRLTFDFVTDKLWTHWKNKTPEVCRDDVRDFLADYESRDAAVGKWRETTRKKLAGNVLSALRDFGLLTGVQRKSLQRPVVPPEVALHLCRLLDAEGLRGRALLDARDWRLFLWELHDTSLSLGQLAQRREIRFERSGQTVMLEVPGHHEGGEG